MKRHLAILLAPMLIFLVSGCSNYVITQELEKPLPALPKCYIAEVHDALPGDVPTEKKPSAEDIGKFKTYMADALLDKSFFGSASYVDTVGAEYLIDASIIEYKKGSGFVRFLFGALGAAKVTVYIELKEINANESLYAGNFKGAVTSETETGDKMFKNVSKDFAKSLRKRMEKLTGNKFK